MISLGKKIHDGDDDDDSGGGNITLVIFEPCSLCNVTFTSWSFLFSFFLYNAE